MSKQCREFELGVLWAGWWLHSAHGEDQLASDMMLEAVGRHGIAALQRLASREEYHFERGFWAALRRLGQR